MTVNMNITKTASVKISTASRLWANDIGLIARYTANALTQGDLEVWEDEHGSFDLRQPDENRRPTVLKDGTGVRFNSYHMQHLTSMIDDESIRNLSSGQDRISIVAVARISDARIPTEFQGGKSDRHPTNVGTFLRMGSTQLNVFRDAEEIEIELTTQRARARWSTGVPVDSRWRTYVINSDSNLTRTAVDGNILEPDQRRGTDFQSRDAGPIQVGFWKQDKALLDIDVAAILVFRHGPSLLDLQARADDLLRNIYPVVDINTSSSLTAAVTQTSRAEVLMQTSSQLNAEARVDLNDLDDLDIWFSARDERLESNPISTWHDLSSNDQNLQMSPHQEHQPLFVSDTCVQPVVRFPNSSIGTTPVNEILKDYTIFIAQKPGLNTRQLPMYLTSAIQVWLRRSKCSDRYNLIVITNPGYLAQRSMLFEEAVGPNEFYDLFIYGTGGNDLSVDVNGQTLSADDVDVVWNSGYPLKYSTGDDFISTTLSFDAESWTTTKGRAPVISGSALTTSGQSNTIGDVRTFAIQHSGLLVMGEAKDSEYAQFALFRKVLGQDEKDFVREYYLRHHT